MKRHCISSSQGSKNRNKIQLFLNGFAKIILSIVSWKCPSKLKGFIGSSTSQPSIHQDTFIIHILLHPFHLQLPTISYIQWRKLLRSSFHFVLPPPSPLPSHHHGWGIYWIIIIIRIRFFLRIQSIPVIFYRCCIVISFSSYDQQQPQTVATVTSSAEDRKIHYPLVVFRFRSTYCMANNRWMMYSCFVRFGDTFLPPPACPLNDSSFLQWIIYQREIHIVVSVQPSGSWKPPSNAAVIVVHQLPGIGGWNGRRIHIHKFLFL